ncbi:hypothetical protein BLOT_015453 [Blomia tropicalis]|nr:hypothetical protein BLOT_015453 [Blomia tropicalis]
MDIWFGMDNNGKRERLKSNLNKRKNERKKGNLVNVGGGGTIVSLDSSRNCAINDEEPPKLYQDFV